MGGAGIVGGVGVGMVTDTAGLSTEAPGTYPRDSPLAPFLTGSHHAMSLEQRLLWVYEHVWLVSVVVLEIVSVGLLARA